MADTITGILKRVNKLQFAVRSPDRSYRPGPVEVMVHPNLTQYFALTEGAAVTGQIQRTQGEPRLVSIESLGGMPPESFRERPRFTDLVAIDPHERFDLGGCGQESMRIVDLIAPVGKGTRQLIVSPPKAGKTILLEQIVRAIHHCSPQSRIIALLVDERPEEVTHFRRAVEGAEVVASTNDHGADEHVELAELMLAHVRIELECGREVVLLIDSLTRLGRAFNNRIRGRSTPPAAHVRKLSSTVRSTAAAWPRFGVFCRTTSPDRPWTLCSSYSRRTLPTRSSWRICVPETDRW